METTAAYRAESTNESSRLFFKTMGNALFGKACEAVRKRQDLKFYVDNEKNKHDILKKLSQKTFKSITEYGDYVKDENEDNVFNHEGFVGIMSDKNTILLDKPIYLGWAILELSKLFIYEFWYNHIKEIYGSNASLLYNDTDSLVIEVHVPLDGDYYEDVKQNRHKYDLSNCGTDPTKPIHYIPELDKQNKKKPLQFKLECGSTVISEMVCTGKKSYSLITVDDQAKWMQKLKGCPIKQKHKQYIENLLECKQNEVTCNMIRSKKHDIHTISMTKYAITPFDCSRHTIPGTVETLALGHWRIKSKDKDYPEYTDKLIDVDPVNLDEIKMDKIVDKSEPNIISSKMGPLLIHLILFKSGWPRNLVNNLLLRVSGQHGHQTSTHVTKNVKCISNIEFNLIYKNNLGSYKTNKL